MIHHENTGDMMTQLSHAARLTLNAVRPRGPTLSGLVQAYAAWQQRKRLATLDDATLRDIGLTREQAQAEATRPVWNAPAQWLR